VSLALLTLSLVALAIGPLTAAIFRKTRWSADLLDGLVLVAVCGLVLVHVLPHTVAVAGWTAIAVATAGFAMPFVAERWRRASDAGHRALVPIVIASFGVHAFIDGAALVEHGGQAHDRFVALAVVLHRLPDGLAIWSVVSVVRGATVAAWVLAVLAGFTALGFALGGHVLDVTSGHWTALLQAFVGGSVLHIVAHRPHAHQAGGGARALTYSVGALIGLGLLVVLAVDVTPAILVAAAGAGLLCWRSRRRAPHHHAVAARPRLRIKVGRPS
jgi:uncharacterized protein